MDGPATKERILKRLSELPMLKRANLGSLSLDVLQGLFLFLVLKEWVEDETVRRRAILTFLLCQGLPRAQIVKLPTNKLERMFIDEVYKQDQDLAQDLNAAREV